MIFDTSVLNSNVNRMKENDDQMSAIVSIGQIDIDSTRLNAPVVTDDLPVLPTRNLVLFPEVSIPITLGRQTSLKVAEWSQNEYQPIGIICQKNPNIDEPALKDLYKYGVVADVLKVLDLPDGSHTAIVKARGKFRVVANGLGSQLKGVISAQVKLVADRAPSAKDTEFPQIVAEIKETASRMAKKLENTPQGQFLMSIRDAKDYALLINTLATQMPFSPDEKESMLAKSRIRDRALVLLGLMDRDESFMGVQEHILEQARGAIEQNNRNAFLQQQMEAIRTELYGEPEDDGDKLLAKAKGANLPDKVMEFVVREIDKMSHFNPQSPDYATQYNYLDNVIALPWSVASELNEDLGKAEEILEADHYGLEKVKERIVEQLAMLMDNPGANASIICLVGPPGVGKTSLGRSIARALGRKYERISLGGLHDEAEIRGHRRTYIGAMPGRIMDAVKRAGTNNPVLLLDELDKIGADFKGDPAAALLEVLDPAQNCKFHDNYIDLDFDLSKVLFIATANTLSTISRPLLDRIEVIDLTGYLLEEKIEIARRHLLPRLKEGFSSAANLIISDDALRAIIENYTSESGVRMLEKKLGAIVRKAVLAAKRGKDFPNPVRPENLRDLLGVHPFIKEKYAGNEFAGVVTGLAWTEVGGEILLVETSLSPGNGEKITLTGNLGNVMKESASIALQWVKAHATQLDIDPDMFTKNNVHIHFPEGAIPKDGPSAGITMATSIVSAFKRVKVAERIAMTGEITLRGKVLPVGGIKEKILAAKRAGITRIILSEENRKDIEDIQAKYVDGMDFVYVNTVDEVMKHALTQEPAIV